jgi:acetyl esterase/lipase
LIQQDEQQPPDVLILYCHGGGFTVGSSYFYIEFLLAWVALLRDVGFRNPALLSVEYSLVPDKRFPTQVMQALAAYQHVLSVVADPSRICVAGDSAGSTLVLSLLLQIGNRESNRLPLPGYCVLISPWTSVISGKCRNTSSDYLDVSTLHIYGLQYLDSQSLHNDEFANPGTCKDASKWKKSSLVHGWCLTYGSEEVFHPEIESFVSVLHEAGQDVSVIEVGKVHAWPVASLFLGENKQARLHGLGQITQALALKMGYMKTS